MNKRQLDSLVVDPGPAGAVAVSAAVGAALEGARPAFCPLPAGPREHVARLVAAIRPDDPATPVEFDEIALCLATAGSAGQPRGVLITAAALTAAAEASDRFLGGPAHWLLALPVHHIGGIGVLVRSLGAGTAPTILASIGGAGPFLAEEFVAATVAARRAADSVGLPLRTALVPTQLLRVLDHGKAGIDALRAFDGLLVGGAATPAAVAKRTAARGIKAISTYGMTETAGGCVYDGRALPGVTVAIRDMDGHGLGRIELAGPMIARGYRLHSTLTVDAFPGGRFLTSDSGRMVDGRLQVSGRLDDVVQVGGVNVSLTAVEDTVMGCPGIELAAAVAVPDEQWGSLVTVFVTTRGSGGDPGESDEAVASRVARHIRQQLGSESRPRQVIVLDDMPLMPNGKIDRAALAHRLRSAGISPQART